MLRVLVFCEYPSLNGGERSLLEAVSRLDSGEFDLVLAAPAAGPLADALRQARLAHVAFDLWDVRGERYPRATLRARVQDLARQLRPAVVHANSLSMTRLAGPVVQSLGIPSIGHLRDMIRLSDASIRDINCHSRLLAVSAATRSWYVSAGVDASKTVVEYNGVNVRQFQPRPATGYLHAELSLPRSVQLIGTIGQIGMRKGLDLLVEAARLITRQTANVHFVVVGQRYSEKQEAREFEARLHRASAEGELAGRLHFLGLRLDIDRLLNELTMYLHAARQEPLGRVLLEAAAAGVPIVATDVGGTSEIFPAAGQAAVLVTPDCPNALADGALQLLASPDLRRLLAQNARRRAVLAFDIGSASRRLAAHYREVASPPAGNVT